MALEVAPAAAQALLGGKQPAAPLREVDHPLFPFGIVHATVDIHGVRQGLTDGVPLRLQIVPEKEVRLRITVHDLLRHGHAGVNTLPLLPRRFRQRYRRVMHQLELAVPICVLAVPAPHDMRPNIQRRQRIAGIVIAQVRGLSDKQRPTRHPQPELILLVRVQCQVVGLGAVPLEKPCQGLSRVHDLQIPGVVDQFLVPVGRWGRRRYQLVLHTLKLRQERLVGFAAEGTQHRRFIQCHGREPRRVDVPVPHPLIVGH